MRDLPLHAFLASLGDEMRPTIRDYERILFALHTGGAWTITRLRDTLLALLVHNEDQQDTFLRRFDAFFKLPPEAQDEYAEIDIEQVRNDLARLTPPEPNGTPDRRRRRRRLVKERLPENGDRFEWKPGLAIPLALVVLLSLAALWYFRPRPPVETVARVELTLPSALLFGNHFVDSENVANITLANSGALPDTIESLTITGPFAGDYRWMLWMSALGHKQTFGTALGMSALPPKADIVTGAQYVR